MDDLDARELRNWLRRELDRKGRGSHGALADAIGVDRSAISRMKNDTSAGEMRQIGAVELLKMMRFFHSVPPSVLPEGQVIDLRRIAESHALAKDEEEQMIRTVQSTIASFTGPAERAAKGGKAR